MTGDDALPGEARIIEAAERVLSGERRGVRAVLPFLGPAFIAAVAYIDPGNFATNMVGGSQFGYMLLWVVLAANLMAMLVQSMSAKLGIADRPQPARGVPRPVSASGSWCCCGCRPRRWRWPPTWPSSSARRSACTWCSACRCGCRPA